MPGDGFSIGVSWRQYAPYGPPSNDTQHRGGEARALPAWMTAWIPEWVTASTTAARAAVAAVALLLAGACQSETSAPAMPRVVMASPETIAKVHCPLDHQRCLQNRSVRAVYDSRTADPMKVMDINPMAYLLATMCRRL